MRNLRLRIAVTVAFLVECGVAYHLLTNTPEPASKAATVAAPAPVAHRVPDYAAECSWPVPEDFNVQVEAAATEFGVDPRLLATTIYRESDCRIDAVGGAGELGLTQVNPKVWTRTLKREGLITDATDLLDMNTNLRAGAFILASCLKRADGDLWGTFRRYNGSGKKARRYADEQVVEFGRLW